MSLLLCFVVAQNLLEGFALLADAIGIRNAHVKEGILSMSPESPGSYVQPSIVFGLRSLWISLLVHNWLQIRLAFNIMNYRLDQTTLNISDIVMSGTNKTS
jgi:hypothetical protein